MIEKMTLERFYEIKNSLYQILKHFDEYIQLHKNDENFNQADFHQKTVEKYLKLQSYLLNYDLSDIPFKAWEGFNIVSDSSLPTVDFSKTKANIDFALIDCGENCNFKGCNIRNLNKRSIFYINPNEFDEQTINDNSSIFLSDSFNNDFKDKYYNNSITIEDLSKLTNEQINEFVDKKGLRKLKSISYQHENFIKLLGLDKIIQLYNHSKEEYEAIIKLAEINMGNDIEDFIVQNKEFNVADFKNNLFNFFKDKFIKSHMKYIPADFPQLFIKENSDLFLINANISEEMKKKYFDRNLTIQDVLEYPEIFLNMPIEHFMVNNIVLLIKKNYRNNEFQELIQKHRDVFSHLSKKDDFKKLESYFKGENSLDVDFSKAIKNYFIENEMSTEFRTINEGRITYNIPTWLSSMNFKFIEKISDLNDLLQCDYNVVVLNSEQRNILDNLGINNIKKFEKDTGFFSDQRNMGDEKLQIFNNYIKNYIDFKNGSLSYEEFQNNFAKLLDYMRKQRVFKNYLAPYDWIQGDFRNNHPEIFIDINAERELKKSFYSYEITPNFLYNNKKYIPFLIDKNLTNTIDANIKLHTKNSINTFGEIVPKYENFIEEYASRYGNENLLKLISDYGEILSDIEISSLNGEIENKEHIEKALRYSIYNKISHDNKPYYQLCNNSEMILEYPNIFLSDDAPEELKNALYNRNIDTEFILSNPQFVDYLKHIDLNIIFKNMPIKTMNNQSEISTNLINIIEDTFDKEDAFNVMLSYGKYLESIYKINELKTFEYNQNMSDIDLLNGIEKIILKNILDGNIIYDENITEHFKNNNPTLFLKKDTPQNIKSKFYNREFNIYDFNENPELIKIFENTNIACGFPLKYSWIISLFNDSENIEIANYKRLKIITQYSKIQDLNLEKSFKDYVLNSKNNINFEKIEEIADILSSLSLSNSNEIYAFRKELAEQILRSEIPITSFKKIEKIFIKNNIPTIGKIYSCFDILHPDFQGFDFDSSTISPVLKNSSTMSKKIIVFSDLIKSSFGSNNKSINSYLKNIEIGSKLYENIKNGHITFNALNETEQNELFTFSKHLETLYNNTMKGKKENGSFISTGNVLTDIFELSKKLSPNGTLEYNLADRVIRMFCGLAGIDTLEQAKEYINKKIQTANERNRQASNKEITLEQGDFIKGIGDITYLKNILQNGSVSKEYLGSSASSDATPLDTDISMIMSSDGTVRDKINSTAANDYGPIWLVLKNDDRFITTRNYNETLDIKRDITKMEVFYTGVIGKGHYGIRTGFASSEINYIVMENYNLRVGLEIAMNGFYIPVANMEGKIVFTPKDYDELREKMSGLSYFDENNYMFSENLVTEETEYFASLIDQNNYEVQNKRNKIYDILKKSIYELGLVLKTEIDGDLTEGFIEIIDTGSTGRQTNKPGDGDFDFIMRLDKRILSNQLEVTKLKQTLLKNLKKENTIEFTSEGDFRLKNIQIDNETNVDIDITFIAKTNKIAYTTDMALKDRLNTIKTKDPEKYRYVIANILLAKQVLKEANVYKPNRGENPQGGLGGVGVENWILQNGGSFIDAARSFVEAADGKSFTEFQSNYQIWDFGENHFAEKHNKYPHDNFVVNNMNKEGFEKMLQILKEYLRNHQIEQEETAHIKI